MNYYQRHNFRRQLHRSYRRAYILALETNDCRAWGTVEGIREQYIEAGYDDALLTGISQRESAKHARRESLIEETR